jgi:hypothetical protein
MKKNVLVSFVTEANSDVDAVLQLRKALIQLPESVLAKIEAFEVLDVAE